MTVTDLAPSPLVIFDSLLRQGTSGEPARLTLHDPLGGRHRIDAAGWCNDVLPGDRSLLDRCEGATLDVGCGPGRLTRALTGPARSVLGIDVSATAVRLARARGAHALRRNVFSEVPGRWDDLLLADGNIGIGGNPGRLLRRCRDLLAPGGRLHVELAAPGVPSWSGPVRISTAAGIVSAPFRWAVAAADDVAPLATAAGLRVVTEWADANRWFATLAP
jgi:SAM-dependent methyltransferase